MPQKPTTAASPNTLPRWKAEGSPTFRAKDHDDAVLYAKHCGYDPRTIARLPEEPDESKSASKT